MLADFGATPMVGTASAYNGIPEWQRASRPGRPELENFRMLNTEPQGSDAAGDDLTLTTPPDGAPTRRTRRRTTTAGASAVAASTAAASTADRGVDEPAPTRAAARRRHAEPPTEPTVQPRATPGELDDSTTPVPETADPAVAVALVGSRRRRQKPIMSNESDMFRDSPVNTPEDGEDSPITASAVMPVKATRGRRKATAPAVAVAVPGTPMTTEPDGSGATARAGVLMRSGMASSGMAREDTAVREGVAARDDAAARTGPGAGTGSGAEAGAPVAHRLVVPPAVFFVAPTGAAGAPDADDEVPSRPARAGRATRAAKAASAAATPAVAAPPLGAASPASAEAVARTGAATAEDLGEPELDPAADQEPTRSRRTRSATRPVARRGRRTPEPVEPEPVAIEELESDDDDDAEYDFDAATGSRRRRRGRRGRGRGRGPLDSYDDAEEPAAASETAVAVREAEGEPEDADGAGADEDDGPLTRRRRRRRRGSAAEQDAVSDDGIVTVVRIRQPRAPRDEVQGVTGSTRLEAKRQRRRDGREQRRTRPPILSESEFLARREAVDRVMVVRQSSDRTQVAVLEDGILVEHYVTRQSASTMVGNVYLGKVQNVLPSMEAAFVDIGRGRNAVLYAGEVNWDATGLEGRARSIEQALKSGESVWCRSPRTRSATRAPG